MKTDKVLKSAWMALGIFVLFDLVFAIICFMSCMGHFTGVPLMKEYDFYVYLVHTFGGYRNFLKFCYGIGMVLSTVVFIGLFLRVLKRTREREWHLRNKQSLSTRWTEILWAFTNVQGVVIGIKVIMFLIPIFHCELFGYDSKIISHVARWLGGGYVMGSLVTKTLTYLVYLIWHRKLIGWGKLDVEWVLMKLKI